MKGEKILQFIKNNDIYLLIAIYIFGVAIRLIPKLEVDSHLPVFLGDVWYRICMSQYILDFHALPIPDIRYIPYGDVPLWYPPLSMVGYSALSVVSGMDLPTVMTRIIPFFEAFTPIPLYFLAKEWFGKSVARLSVIFLAVTPSFILYSSIADPQILTLMVIPVVLVYLSRQQYKFSVRSAIGCGILLGITFLTHLSYFIIIGIMALYIIARFLDKRQYRNELKFVLISIGISLLVSIWWWLPDFLFYWWIFVITTSTLLQTFGSHLSSYGTPFMIMGFIGFGYLLVDRLSIFNHKETRNPYHTIALTIIFSLLTGVFIGKTITAPAVASLGLLYALLVLSALKMDARLAVLLSAAVSIIIATVGCWYCHEAGNIGAWTKTFIFTQSLFSNEILALAGLGVALFLFFITGIWASHKMRTYPQCAPMVSIASYLVLVVATYLMASSYAMGAREILGEYYSLQPILGLLGILLVPMLFLYQYKGKVSRYILSEKYITFMVLWTIFLLYEVFSENILAIVREYGLMWETTVRPLEGYRFYIFLAQPFAIMGSLMLVEIRKHKNAYTLGFIIFISAMGYFSLEGGGMPDYDMDFKITNSGVMIEDYNAALWYRESTDADARIVADYYTGQMFSGVCAGKSLIGGLFPLRNIDFNEYIKAPAQVQDDIHDFYSTEDVAYTIELAERYGLTHVYISDNMASRGWLGSYKDSSFGVPVNWDKFFTSDEFTLVYQDTSNPYNKTYIFEISP